MSSLSIALMIGGAALAAAPQSDTASQSQVLNTALACRAIGDASARLACFDRSMAEAAKAIAQGTVYVVDGASVARAEREQFGSRRPARTLPGIPAGTQKKIREVDGVVQSANLAFDGNWIIMLQDGSTWQQVDGLPIARAPEPGTKVTVKLAAFNTFRMNVGGQPAVRVKRLG